MKKADKKSSKSASKPRKKLSKILEKIRTGIRSKIRSIKKAKPSKAKISKASPKPTKPRAARKSKTDLTAVRPLLDQAPVLEKTSPEPAEQAHHYELPRAYHEDKLTLLVRDPWWLYAFWEVTPARERTVLEEMNRRGLSREQTVLRVYDVTGADPSKPNSHFDIELRFFTENWYVDVGKPDCDWFAEVGIRAADGSFFALVRSNVVRTPRFGISDVLDEEWLMPDAFYWQLFGYASGLGAPLSSMNGRALVERYLQNVAGELSSFTGGPAAPKFDIGPVADK